MAERRPTEPARRADADAAAEEMERQNAVAADAARSATGEPEKRLDETVPGGKYRTADGRLVDANGKPVKD